jgi:aromatic ring-cleaving dioxygenase
MSAPLPLDPGSVRGYHAHIYYAPGTKEKAAALRAEIAERFPQALLGRWHDEPVGPHPVSMYQIAFATELFPRLVPYLMLNRRDLAVLVHPETGNDYRDHSRHALWLGAILPLALDKLPGDRD